ncbi:hypothetical protein SAMN05660657_04404 [Geodermatophilus amargosae]|uniref:Uncharacterized protein n=1 Tax=Geodermatophilus amargosae TaxID=1296565 RepID=A0A1I7CFL0_9ACTN|nr:hypothetical protein [Geodermatophilus amargosae]SFT98181.1 hypothetical protein SAMN05660657_04404 [Geodermatophilus amargosae]
MIFSLTNSTGRHPLTGFSLLLLGHGFALGHEFVDVVKDAWHRILSVPPFNDVLTLEPAKRTISVYADQQAGDLGLEQFGAHLEIVEAKQDNLRNYLATTSLRVLGEGSVTEESAIRVWPEQGRQGRVGSLVAVLVKGDQPAELYQLTSTPRYPVPLVAVVVAGEHWGKVLVRGVAQTFAQLSDEFELPGLEFRRAPLTLVEPRPNILVLTESQRAELAAGGRAQEVIGFPPGWGIDRKTTLTFHPHQGEEPDESTIRKATGRTQLVEGGAGYRFGVLRGDFDCLMRRQPNSTALPIQAPGVEFCRPCWAALREQLNSWRDTNLGRRPRILIDSQRPICDTVGWKTGESKPATDPFDLEVGTQPAWACSVEPGPAQGLRLVNVRLKNRPGDPFSQVEEIFSRIEFSAPRVKFAGEQEQVLPFAQAFANTAEAPELQVLTDATSNSTTGGFLGAVRLALTWRIPGHWSVEAVLSVTFKDKNNDFDPGGAAIGNKLYPQMSIRYRRPPKSETGRLSKIDWLAGSIRLHPSNVFPTDLPVHADLHHFLTGTQQITLTTDSNSSDDDSTYKWDREDVSEVFIQCSGEAVPEWGLWGAEWESGRLLATVLDPSLGNFLPDRLALKFAGAVARRGHLTRNLPGLPHWSWLFDYVTPLSSGSRRFVAVYRRGELTGANLDGGLDREIKVRWPAGDEEYTMTVEKWGRQGAYDNLHVHPGMGLHGGREVVPAPFCADLCTHLHWRWGAVTQSGQLPATPGALDRPQFLGWGRTGRLDQGAHTTLGAPLVPPNQHVEVALDLGARSVSYEVRAHDPDFDAYQVILEQGTGVLYTYGGMQVADLANLAGALGVFNPMQIQDRKSELAQLAATDPARFDRVIRVMFHEIYDRIRWYDVSLHDDVSANTQQVPDQLGVQRSLEEL